MQLALVLAAEQNTANSLFPRPKVIEARCAVVVRNFCGRITRPKDRALPGKASTSERGGRDQMLYSIRTISPRRLPIVQRRGRRLPPVLS